MRSRASFVSTGIVSFLVVGCAEFGADSSTFIVTDSAGVRIVVNHGPVWDTGEEWSLSAEPFLEIGTVDGERDKQFSGVLGVRRLSDGRIVVLDGGTAELRFFDAAGEFLILNGGSGQGPGEFNRPRGLLRLRGDTLLVSAYFDHEASRFAPSGEFLDLSRLDSAKRYEVLGEIWGCPGSYGLLPDVTIFACVGSAPIRQQHPDYPRGGHVLVRTPYDVSWADSIGYVYGSNFNLALAAPGSLIAAGGDPLRIVIGDPAFFEINVFGDRIGQQVSIRYPGGIPSVSETDGGALLAGMRERVASMPSTITLPSGEVARVAEAPTAFAATLPGFTNLHYDDDGFIWAVGYVPPWETGAWAFVLMDSGELLGRVELPESFQIHEIGRDYILGVWRNDLDVEFVRMYALNRG